MQGQSARYNNRGLRLLCSRATLSKHGKSKYLEPKLLRYNESSADCLERARANTMATYRRLRAYQRNPSMQDKTYATQPSVIWNEQGDLHMLMQTSYCQAATHTPERPCPNWLPPRIGCHPDLAATRIGCHPELAATLNLLSRRICCHPDLGDTLNSLTPRIN